MHKREYLTRRMTDGRIAVILDARQVNNPAAWRTTLAVLHRRVKELAPSVILSHWQVNDDGKTVRLYQPNAESVDAELVVEESPVSKKAKRNLNDNALYAHLAAPDSAYALAHLLCHLRNGEWQAGCKGKGDGSSVVQTICGGSCWGFESDGGEENFRAEEDNALAELRQELVALGFSKRAVAKAVKDVERVTEWD